MILETRRLFFSNAALRKAFAWYQRAASQSDLPTGMITAVVPRVGGAVLVTLQQSGTSRLREFLFPPGKTIGVLLYFCRKQRIPIPRDGDKDIAATEDGLALTIRHQLDVHGPAV